MRFIGVCGTSNTRQFDVYGRYNVDGCIRDYHTYKHQCCILGGDRHLASDYINKITEVKVASFPGLSLKNIGYKKCYAGPYQNLTVSGFLSNICSDENFSGTLAMVMLCNDHEHLQTTDSAETKVKSYLQKLATIFESVANFEKVKFIIFSTALHRQEDFWTSTSKKVYCDKKQNFNKCFVRNADTDGFRLCVASEYIPYAVVDMSAYIPVEQA